MSREHELLLRGKPFSQWDIIDSHNHLGPWQAFYVRGNGSIERMLHRADLLGIRKLCVTAHAAIGPDQRLGNDLVADAISVSRTGSSATSHQPQLSGGDGGRNCAAVLPSPDSAALSSIRISTAGRWTARFMPLLLNGQRNMPFRS